MDFETSLREFRFLSELYFIDSPNATLLAEYPCSNTDATRYFNGTKYIIHDPFPPPKRSLVKYLGPHHLMCGWGDRIEVTSEVAPPQPLQEHWASVLGEESLPVWKPTNESSTFITLFPHEAIPAEQQVVDPDVNYDLHAKQVIGRIECPQPPILDAVQIPCIAKLSHGYAGLGNYLIRSSADEAAMRSELNDRWPDTKLFITEVVEDIVGDFGVQFYLKRDGSFVCLGFTEQLFTSKLKWCGGTFSFQKQIELYDQFMPIVAPTAEYLHQQGYFGVVGIDILQDRSGKLYLVDVNPRLTGISPFLIANRLFARDGFTDGIYQASCEFQGDLLELIKAVESCDSSRVLVLSAYEDSVNGKTICHLSSSSSSLDRAQNDLRELLGL